MYVLKYKLHLLLNQDSRHFTGQKTYIVFLMKAWLYIHCFPVCPWRKEAIVYLLQWEIPLKTQNVCHPTPQKRPGSSSMYQGKLCHWFQQLRSFSSDRFFLHFIHSNKLHKPLSEWRPTKISSETTNDYTVAWVWVFKQQYEAKIQSLLVSSELSLD